MRRDYTIEAYHDLLARVRRAVPDIAVSTDVIVGFPGEEESDHAATESFLREARYDFAPMLRSRVRRNLPAYPGKPEA